jgi:SpoVK/Ycf46/Vps4 family AAA+-type ATPase
MAAVVPTHRAAIEPYGSSSEHLRDELLRIDLLIRGQVVRARQASGDDPYRGLAISEAEIEALLARAAGTPPWDASSAGPPLDEARARSAGLAEVIARRCACSREPLRLAQLAARFGLSRFELDVVLIALAPEIDLLYERLYAYLHDDVTRKRPSVELTLQLLCGSLDERMATRARLGAAAPLVRHGIVRMADEPPGAPLLARAIKLDDRVVDWLHGGDALAPRLARYARRIAPAAALSEVIAAPAVHEVLRRLAAADAPPVLYLEGAQGAGKRTIAEALARAWSREVVALDGARLEGLPDGDAEEIVRAAAREAHLAADALLVEHAELLLASERRGARGALLDAIAEAPGPVVLAGEVAWEPSDALRGRPVVRIPIGRPDARAQARLWRGALAGARLDADVELDRLAGRLRLTGGQIHDAAATARGLAHARAGDGTPLAMADLDEACRRHSSRRFGPLARKVPARLAWDDLVLAGDRVDRLRELCDHARQRAQVLERWGFDRRLPSGKGLGVLFAGPPGTGKTLAASIVATELGLDLFQIDLAAVVSKWVGETEKHLSRIFDEAERGHGVLFFDEADALFGKRTEVHDAHDRYANLETSYLLQRIEEFDGVVILASNFRRNLDEAFVRRLRFIVEFPLPDEAERRRIWEQIWPAEAPRAPDLDLALMARRFELAGAYIRNIALAAAFLAAAEGAPIAQRHLLHATRREYQKLGKMVDESLLGGQP